MEPACEVNEKGTRGKNDGNEVVEEGSSPPLNLDPNEVIEADEETLPYAEEDWQEPEQMEIPKSLEPDLPYTACEPGKLGPVLDETEGLPCGKGSKGTLASNIRPEPRTTASTGAICTDTRNFF